MTYFFLIPFVNNRIFPSTNVLLSEPVLLNTELILKPPLEASNNFAISMWVYINPGSLNKPGYAIESPIFSYLDGSGNAYIKLTYSNINKGNNDFIMHIGEQQYPISLPLQKWNNFVFNHVTYDDISSKITPQTSIFETSNNTPIPSEKKTTVDMFVNGNLEYSFTYENDNIPQFSSITDTIYIGSTNIRKSSISTAKNGVKGTTGKNTNNDGLYGSICNIIYYNQPLTKMAITYHYNIHTIRNPPV
jgi:hypothetical protein